MTDPIRLTRVAHGGVVVGRTDDDKVVFVTGGLPGELVRVEITHRTRRFDRGRVVEVLEAAPGRVAPPCPIADRCGGCDWQHASPALQLELKTAVVAEQLQRLAGIDWQGTVEAVPPSLGWRTRMRYAVDEGRVGLRARRSHDVVPLPPQGCIVASPGPTVPELEHLAAGAQELQVVSSDDGITALAGTRLVRGRRIVHQSVAGHEFTLSAEGFWQVHPRAAELLTTEVVRGLQPSLGTVALDLYCGVGLFAAALVAVGCRVLGVEASRGAVEQARVNVPRARFIAGGVEKHLDSLPAGVDVVVLDPPRSGAGEKVVQRIAALRPRAIAYVACDPSALARDLATFASCGFAPESIRAFDLFPMTQHVECVAILVPTTTGASRPQRGARP